MNDRKRAAELLESLLFTVGEYCRAEMDEEFERLDELDAEVEELKSLVLLLVPHGD